jgi:hypothetical protein
MTSNVKRVIFNVPSLGINVSCRIFNVKCGTNYLVLEEGTR